MLSPHGPRRPLGALFFSLLLWSAAASASSESDAESFVQAGIEARRDHHNEEALILFRKAWAITKTPRIRAQIALAEQSLGRWADAETDLVSALEAKTDPWVSKNRPALEDALANIGEHLGWLAIDCNVAGALISVDGGYRATTPLSSPIRVAAGTVVVEVAARGYLTVKRPVLVLPKLNARERFDLVATASPTPSSPPMVTTDPVDPGPREGDTQRYLGYAVAGVGVVGLGLGTYFGIVAFARKADRDPHCDDKTCDADGLVYDQQAHTASTRSNIAFVAGGAFLAAGVGLVLTAPRSSPWHAIRLAPTVGLREGGVRLETRW